LLQRLALLKERFDRQEEELDDMKNAMLAEVGTTEKAKSTAAQLVSAIERR